MVTKRRIGVIDGSLVEIKCKKIEVDKKRKEDEISEWNQGFIAGGFILLVVVVIFVLLGVALFDSLNIREEARKIGVKYCGDKEHVFKVTSKRECLEGSNVSNKCFEYGYRFDVICKDASLVVKI